MNDYPLITGFGFAVPDKVWDNHHLEKIVDTSDEWIQSRTGIVTRCIAGKKETTATLAAKAARAAAILIENVCSASGLTRHW